MQDIIRQASQKTKKNAPRRFKILLISFIILFVLVSAGVIAYYVIKFIR